MPKATLCEMCVNHKCPVKRDKFFQENTIQVRSCSAFTPLALAEARIRVGEKPC